MASSNSLFWPKSSVSVEATTTTAATAFTASGSPVVMLTNVGSVPVFIKFGSASVTVTVTDGMPILPGTKELFQMAQLRPGTSENPSYFACITESGSARICATVGEGEI